MPPRAESSTEDRGLYTFSHLTSEAGPARKIPLLAYGLLVAAVRFTNIVPCVFYPCGHAEIVLALGLGRFQTLPCSAFISSSSLCAWTEP